MSTHPNCPTCSCEKLMIADEAIAWLDRGPNIGANGERYMRALALALLAAHRRNDQHVAASPSPSAGEKLVERLREIADLLDRNMPQPVHESLGRRVSSSVALAQARRTIDKRVIAYHELAEDFVRVTAERDEAVRACAEIRERCAKVCEEWLRVSELLLHCGEMSAQEIRTVKAVLTNRAAAIRALPLPALAGEEVMEKE